MIVSFLMLLSRRRFKYINIYIDSSDRCDLPVPLQLRLCRVQPPICGTSTPHAQVPHPARCLSSEHPLPCGDLLGELTWQPATRPLQLDCGVESDGHAYAEASGPYEPLHCQPAPYARVTRCMRP